MSKEFLQKKSCKELREIAKELDIKGRWDMKKEKLVETILTAKNVEDYYDNETGESATDELEIVNQTDVEIEIKTEKESVNVEHLDANKMKYIENIEIGALVAFKQESGKVRSAKVDKKSCKRRMLKLVTEYGAEFAVSYADIVWVRTGKRWPRGVYNMLKGLGTVNEATATRAN